MPKQQAEGMRIMLSNFAYNLNPENPAQFLRDNGLRFVGEVTGDDNGGKKWYNQITNATINLDDQIAVQPVQNVLETDNWRDAVKNYPKDVVENLVTGINNKGHEPYVNRNTGFKIIASKSSIEHFLSPSTSTTKEAAQKAREAGEEYENPRADIDRYKIISELPQIAENAILVEEHADSHGRAKAIYRMFCPLQLEDKIVVVKFTVQKVNTFYKLVDNDMTDKKAYDVLLIKKIEDRKESYPQGQRISFPQGSGEPGSHEGAPQDLPNISIREMLQNVKDQNGNPYINADGTGNFSILTESGKVDFSGNTGFDYLTGDAVYNQEQLQQTAEQKLERDNEAWNQLLDRFRKSNKAEWKEKNNGKLFTLMQTPLVLQLPNIDARNAPLKVFGSFFKHVAAPKHLGMDYNLMKDLPKLLADPLMIYKSGDKFIMVLDKVDNNRAPMVASIELDKQLQHYVVNVVNSVYGRTKTDGNAKIPNYQGLGDDILKGLLYINKKRSNDWAGTIRKEYPVGVLLLNQASSLPNIHDKTDLVKLKEQNPGYYQNNTTVTKGQISFSDNGQALIQLFKASDASTVIHETGHYCVFSLRNTFFMLH